MRLAGGFRVTKGSGSTFTHNRKGFTPDAGIPSDRQLSIGFGPLSARTAPIGFGSKLLSFCRRVSDWRKGHERVPRP